MQNILDTTKEVALLEPTETVETIEKVEQPKRATCRNCETKRKPNVEWYSADFCSGKCERLYNPIDAPPEPEKVMPKTSQGKCLFCGNTPKAGTKWYNEDYCSGKCAKRDGIKTYEEPTIKENCRNCGTARKPDIIWYDNDYCSGKCCKQDGGTLKSEAESKAEDDKTPVKVTEKQEQIKALNAQLVTYRIEHTKADKEASEAIERRSDVLADGGDDSYDAYQKAVDRRNTLANTIAFIEETTLPKLYKELQAVQEADKGVAVQALMKTRDEVVKKMQTHLTEIDKLLSVFDAECKKMKYGYPRGKITPVRELCMSDDLRKALLKRTNRRDAQKTVHGL